MPSSSTSMPSPVSPTQANPNTCTNLEVLIDVRLDLKRQKDLAEAIASRPASFTWFPHLPYELRAMIWKCHALFASKTVETIYDSTLKKWYTPILSRATLSPLLTVNAESRTLYISTQTILCPIGPSSSLSKLPSYFNPAIDNLYIGPYIDRDSHSKDVDFSLLPILRSLESLGMDWEELTSLISIPQAMIRVDPEFSFTDLFPSLRHLTIGVSSGEFTYKHQRLLDTGPLELVVMPEVLPAEPYDFHSPGQVGGLIIRRGCLRMHGI